MRQIVYGFSDSPFGHIIVARTWEGICDLQFLDYNRLETIHQLAKRWGVYTPTTQNDTMAQMALGLMYEGGEGVKKDLAVAREWYDKACKRGLKDACTALERVNGQ